MFAFMMYAAVAIVGNAVHMSFHVRGFHLEKYEWYMQLRALHYIHHLGDMNHDFAMVSMYIDWCFGSLASRDPACKAQVAPPKAGAISCSPDYATPLLSTEGI